MLCAGSSNTGKGINEVLAFACDVNCWFSLRCNEALRNGVISQDLCRGRLPQFLLTSVPRTDCPDV